jgi:uncharacterized membrane protein YuzA (DUF378 family)
MTNYYFSNFFQIGAAVVFALGVWTLVDKNFVNDLLGTNLFSGAVYVLIGTSAVTCLLSFFGCMGAAKGVKCMLLTVSLSNTSHPLWSASLKKTNKKIQITEQKYNNHFCAKTFFMSRNLFACSLLHYTTFSYIN